jgi:hypothetical protein
MGLLDSLGTVDSKEKPKTGKREKPVVDLVGLTNYAALATVAKQIETLMKGHKVKAAAARYFVAEGRQLKKTPQNVDGREGVDATASVQLRKRNSSQPLDADTVALCADLGIETFKHIIAPNTMRVKPALFAAHPELMEKLIAAGAKAIGMDPAAVFEIQKEESKVLVEDKTIDDLFALGSNHTDDRVLEILGKLAISDGAMISAKFQGTLAAAFEIARIELAPTPAEMKAREAAAAEAAKANPDAAPQAGSANIMDALKASLAAEGGSLDLPTGGGGEAVSANRKGGRKNK